MIPMNNNILQQFQQFCNQIKGKNPQQMLQALIQSGRVTQQQVDQARKLAEQFKGLLH